MKPLSTQHCCTCRWTRDPCVNSCSTEYVIPAARTRTGLPTHVCLCLVHKPALHVHPCQATVNAFISRGALSSLQGWSDIVGTMCWETFVGTATLQLAESKLHAMRSHAQPSIVFAGGVECYCASVQGRRASFDGEKAISWQKPKADRLFGTKGLSSTSKGSSPSCWGVRSSFQRSKVWELS